MLVCLFVCIICLMCIVYVCLYVRLYVCMYMAVCMCSYMYAYSCVMLPNLITVANACKTLLFSPPSAMPTMRLSQDFSRLLLLFLVNSPILVVYDFFLLQVLSNIVHPNFVLYEFLSLLPGSD